MDHAGKGDPELPAVATWSLPPMAEGGTWSASHTVAGEAAGWYRVMANAYTRGPDGGPWLFDDVLASAWMHVDDTDGRLAPALEDSVAAGPAAGWPAPLARSPDYPFLHPDTVYLRVVYSISQREGFQPAVEAQVEGTIIAAGGAERDLGYRIVPEDGIVAFRCPAPKGSFLLVAVHAPHTDLVLGSYYIAALTTDRCGTLLELEVPARSYYPWRLLNLAADTLTRHFGHTREMVWWRLDEGGGGSYYRWTDEITLGWGGVEHDRFRYVVAHEYGHALHHKALGGLFGKFSTPGCSDHQLTLPSSYECALSEGFANYAGNIGSHTRDYPEGFLHDCLEYFGTPEGCSAPHDRKPEIEGWVAALFMDLIDDNDNYEGFYDDAFDDLTHYSGSYVAGVFKSCEAKRGNFLDPWKHRSKVYDFVWCLEEYVHKPTHERVFPDTPVPDTAKHKRPPHRPKNWHWADIRETWLRNLAEEGR